MDLIVKVFLDDEYLKNKAFDGLNIKESQQYIFKNIENNKIYLEMKDFLKEQFDENSYVVYFDNNKNLVIDLTMFNLITDFRIDDKYHPFITESLFFDYEFTSPEEVLTFLMEKTKENKIKEYEWENFKNSKEYKKFQNIKTNLMFFIIIGIGLIFSLYRFFMKPIGLIFLFLIIFTIYSYSINYYQLKKNELYNLLKKEDFNN